MAIKRKHMESFWTLVLPGMSYRVIYENNKGGNLQKKTKILWDIFQKTFFSGNNDCFDQTRRSEKSPMENPDCFKCCDCPSLLQPYFILCFGNPFNYSIWHFVYIFFSIGQKKRSLKMYLIWRPKHSMGKEWKELFMAESLMKKVDKLWNWVL